MGFEKSNKLSCAKARKRACCFFQALSRDNKKEMAYRMMRKKRGAVKERGFHTLREYLKGKRKSSYDFIFLKENHVIFKCMN